MAKNNNDIKFFSLAIDSEFVSEPLKNNNFISLQIADKKKSYIYKHWDRSRYLGANHLFDYCLSNQNDNFALAKYLKLNSKDVEVSEQYLNNYSYSNIVENVNKRIIFEIKMFFSPADIVALYHSSLIKYAKWFLFHLEDSKNRITGVGGRDYPIWTGLYFNYEGEKRPVYLHIKDFSAMAGKKSLDDLFTLVGIETETKNLVKKEEKADMMVVLRKRPKDFIAYAKGDVQYLFELEKRYTNNIKNIYKELNVTPYKKNKTDNPFKITAGGNVGNILISCFVDKLFEKDTDPREIKRVLSIIKSLNEANPNFLSKYKSETMYGAKYIDGGRCRNERLLESVVKGRLVDVDIKGCYANSLSFQSYPIGLPVIITYDRYRGKLQVKLTLGEFLSKYRSDLIPGLWIARISTRKNEDRKKTPLSFSQDLIFSKIYGNTDSDDGVDKKQVEYKIFFKEIINGLLNHDLLQVIEACTSNEEKKEIFENIIIESAIFYPKSLEYNNFNKWLNDYDNYETTGNNKILNKLTKKYHILRIDKRFRGWVRLDLNSLLIKKLKELRAKYEHTDKTRKEFYKLIINTLYGKMSSEHWVFSNVVVGNNVTARARAYTYLMNKALGTYQTITDGGLISLKVNTFKNNCPSMNTLTFINNKQYLSKNTAKRLSHKKITIPDIEPHVKKFFSKYEEKKNIKIDVLNIFNLEVKEMNESKDKKEKLIKTAVLHSTANYQFETKNGVVVEPKARGYHLTKKEFYDKEGNKLKRTQHTIIDFFNQLRTSKDNEYIQLFFEPIYQPKILKITEWKKNLKKYEKVAPGDNVLKKSHFCVIKKGTFYFDTKKSYDNFNKISDGKILVKLIQDGLIKCKEDNAYIKRKDYPSMISFIQDEIITLETNN